MAENKVQVAFYVDKDIKKILEDYAKKIDRPFSYTVNQIVMDALQAKGFIKK